MNSFVEVRSKLKEKFFLFYFITALMFLAFIYGFSVSDFKIFPYSLFRSGSIAAKEFWAWAEPRFVGNIEGHPHLITLESGEAKRLRRYDPDRAYAGLTFAEIFANDRFALVLLDMKGEVLHRWDVPESIYTEIKKQDWPLRRDHYEIMGSHLYPNGDVLLIITYIGLVKIDRCSNLQWFLADLNHHGLAVADDGTIWVLAMENVTRQVDADPRMTVPYRRDKLQRVTSDGEVTEEIVILDALFAGNYEALVLDGPQDFPRSTNSDPTHANDVEIVGADFARRHDFAEPGDILVSLRTTDSIILIDRESRAVKWALAGPFLRQHDPDLLADGTISIFDNRTDWGQHNHAVRLTARPIFGYSRILRLDPATQKILWQYQGTEQEPFYTSIQGDHQILPNGNVLVAEAEAGRIFEIDATDKTIVWEWFNLVERPALGLAEGPANGSLVGRITRVNRYPPDYPTFLARGCSQ